MIKISWHNNHSGHHICDDSRIFIGFFRLLGGVWVGGADASFAQKYCLLVVRLLFDERWLWEHVLGEVRFGSFITRFHFLPLLVFSFLFYFIKFLPDGLSVFFDLQAYIIYLLFSLFLLFFHLSSQILQALLDSVYIVLESKQNSFEAFIDESELINGCLISRSHFLHWFLDSLVELRSMLYLTVIIKRLKLSSPLLILCV